MSQAILAEQAHIRISGPDAQHFLHNLLTTDIVGLRQGIAMPGALLTAQGKILFSFLAAREGAGYVLELALRDAGEFYKRLKFYRLRAKADIAEPIPVDMAITWGESAPPPAALKDGRFTAVDVWRSPAAKAMAGERDAWTALRIAHGVAEPHLDFAYGDVFPHDVNLDQIGGVSFKKGCYVGQEVVSRMQHRGTARRRLMIASGDGPMSAGTEIMAGSKAAGVIGSVSGAVGMALVRLDRIKDALDKGEAITAGGTPVTVQFPQGVSYGWPATGAEA